MHKAKGNTVSSLPFPFSVLINLFPSPLSDPTRSPTITHVIHLRRRKTLRMFLARRRFHPPPQDPAPLPEARVRHKLKDHFVSSPPTPFNEEEEEENNSKEKKKQKTSSISNNSKEKKKKKKTKIYLSNSSLTALSLRLRTGSPFRGTPPQLSARYPSSSATGC
ncbi:hypothetical protein LR48_Vigan01g049600 [Vigna angularis]|uniref:Uncharacterized protein n=1 Tax=Phaseolus angularis TaxID=3914 RepID=A0A0L9TKF1_PHAAN|nr:hypothetical protein LR48_Vigan01g049600 [Vigna angularis]